MNRHLHQTSCWRHKTPLHHRPRWHPHHQPPRLHYQHPPSPLHRSFQHCELSRYHINRVESVVLVRPWFNSNVDQWWIGRQMHWNESLPQSAKMLSTKSMPIGRLWKWIGLVLNGSSQKGSSWIWSRADFWNVRFGSSCSSTIERSINCARFCKMVSTRFTPAVHCAFLLMHFMITT